MASHKERVLVVDDEDGVRNMVRESLSFLGITCLTASNAEEALEIIQREPFDLILSDIRMPGMDGLELLQKIKEDRPDLDVIIMTGYAEEYSFIDVINAGASDFILKPFPILELKAKIFRVFKERVMISELLEVNRQLGELLSTKEKEIQEAVSKLNTQEALTEENRSLKVENEVLKKQLNRVSSVYWGHRRAIEKILAPQRIDMYR